MTNRDRQIDHTIAAKEQKRMAAATPQISRIIDIASVESIMDLRYRPACRAGSAHLMTPAELYAAISEIAERAKIGFLNVKESLAALIASREARLSETEADRTWRLRQRIAWELAEEKGGVRKSCWFTSP